MNSGKKKCVVIIYFVCLVLHVLTVKTQNCVAGQYSTPVECNNGDAACDYYSWDREIHNICRPAYTVEQYNPDNEFLGEFCTVCCAMCLVGKNTCKPGTCVNCPANSISPANNTSLEACVCHAGFTGPNGGPCTACVSGTYKTTTGSVACTNCESTRAISRVRFRGILLMLEIRSIMFEILSTRLIQHSTWTVP